jgi:2-phosphoglycerate kinase
MKKIILIGGASGTGKSTLAKKLSEHFKIPWVSTDQLRTVQGIDEKNQEKQIELTWKGVSALIQHPHPWEAGIIEGIAITPQLLARDFGDKLESIIPLFLFQEDTEKITEVVHERSKLPWINTKTPEQQAVRVQEMITSNEVIRESARQNDFPTITGNQEDTFKNALEILNLG